ncbi:Rpn family recombination-promoting nuclease/putative transposase [Prevotella sp.]|jgi:predicted transposase/invertase (TIGR01784 family)|uniref:Rpn family recombination-promoting nuclease/putative transposase n=2 Tax=Prevotella sp. TaxID=59823 RepID=UPI0025FF23B3|nr:Rpn family recombination-promoting nuclease/putative transposase [Prevotella sp.]
MRQSEERYISLLTDFGFKRIFGTDPNKELLINFLNSLFDGEEVIKDVKYLNSENVGDVYTERKAIFDVYCENEQGEKFIVEMQNAYQTYFKDRSLFYSTFPIREQAPKGSDWNFCLKKVYVVALLNYKMSDEAFDSTDTIHTIALMDTKTNKVFNAKLMFKYVEVGRFDKTDEELTSLSDKWMYVLKNLSRLDNRPSSLREKIFTKLFDAAAIARFSPNELREYEDSLKAYRDIKNSLDTAKEEGRAEGREEGRAEGREEGRKEGRAEGREEGRAEGREEGRAEGIAMVAKMMYAKGIDVDVIASMTGMAIDKIKALCRQ